MPGTTLQYYLHGILLDATWIGELTDVTPAANVELITKYAGAAIVPSFRGAHGAKPEITFRTPAIKTILDLCTDGDGISLKDYNDKNVDLYYRLASNFGTRAAIGEASHLLVRAKRSMLYWTRIEARQNQIAEIECRVVPTFDGTNNPLAGLGSQTIPADVLAPSQWTLGPVKANGSFIDGVQGWTLEQNHELNEKASDGQTFLTFVGIRRCDPVLSIDTPDLSYWVTPGTDGVQLTALLAYLTKKSSDGTTNVADAAEEHIKFSNNDSPCGFLVPNQGSAGVQQEASLGLRANLRISTGTTLHPLAVDTAAAIA